MFHIHSFIHSFIHPSITNAIYSKQLAASLNNILLHLFGLHYKLDEAILSFRWIWIFLGNILPLPSEQKSIILICFTVKILNLTQHQTRHLLTLLLLPAAPLQPQCFQNFQTCVPSACCALHCTLQTVTMPRQLPSLLQVHLLSQLMPNNGHWKISSTNIFICLPDPPISNYIPWHSVPYTNIFYLT